MSRCAAAAGNLKRRVVIAAICLGLLCVSGCVGERAAVDAAAVAAIQSIAALFSNGVCGDFYLEEISPSFSYSLDSVVAGDTSGLTVEMAFPDHITTPILATYQVDITVPSEFSFLGVDALGASTEIGSWQFDFSNPDGVFDGSIFTIVHRSIDSTSAYSDSDGSLDYSPGIDPTASYATGGGGVHVITLILPDGGIEQGTYGMCSYFAFDARYRLLDGILRLPNTAGDYDITITATSIDLDTGNATDNTEPHPLSFNDSFVVSVPEPGSAPLASVSLATLLALAARRRRAGRRVSQNRARA